MVSAERAFGHRLVSALPHGCQEVLEKFVSDAKFSAEMPPCETAFIVNRVVFQQAPPLGHGGIIPPILLLGVALLLLTLLFGPPAQGMPTPIPFLSLLLGGVLLILLRHVLKKVLPEILSETSP